MPYFNKGETVVMSMSDAGKVDAGAEGLEADGA